MCKVSNKNTRTTSLTSSWDLKTKLHTFIESPGIATREGQRILPLIFTLGTGDE